MGTAVAKVGPSSLRGLGSGAASIKVKPSIVDGVLVQRRNPGVEKCGFGWM